MRSVTKKIAALLLCALLLVTSAGCGYMLLGCAALSCIGGASDSIREEVAESVQSGLSGAIPDLNELFDNVLPTADPNLSAAPLEKSEGSVAANEAFAALDREMFVWYVTSDIITLDQYCYDPSLYGIDESTVPVTLGEVTEEHDAKWIADCRSWLSRLEKIDRAELSDQYALAYDNYVRYFKNQIASEGLFYQYEPFKEIVGIQLDLPLVFGLYDFKDVTDVKNYLTLLADVPRYFAQLVEVEKKRAEMGIFMTEAALDEVLSDFDNVIESRNDSYLFDTFREALQDVDWLTDAQKSAFYAQNDALVSGVFTDAYADTRDALEALRPYCREMTGAANVSDDALRYFELEIKVESGSDMTVDEAIAFMENTMDDLYIRLRQAVRRADNLDTDSFTTGTIEGDERYLKTLITDIVPPMPNISVVYKDIPKELQEGFSPAAYLLPSLDHYTENTILINPTSDTDLMTLAHEGYPGHMFQYTYQYSLGTIPLFQCVIEPIGYSEGWSTNAEYSVAKRADMFGAANVTANELNNNLTNAIVTVSSLLVNGKGYSKEQLRKYLDGWGMASYTERIWELVVDLPSYYFKYSMGFCKQYALTERCRKIYNFNDKDFYREYLSWGPSSYDFLEPKMVEWAQKNAK